MIFPSFIPKAQKLTKEEIDYPGLNDRVICGFFPVTAYLIILVVLYVVMNATVISSVRQHKIDSRKKSCTYRVTAEFRRNIVNWNEKAAEDQRFRGIPEYIYCFEG